MFKCIVGKEARSLWTWCKSELRNVALTAPKTVITDSLELAY